MGKQQQPHHRRRSLRPRDQIPCWLLVGLAGIVAMTGLSVKISLECLERQQAKPLAFAPTSRLAHLLVLVHPERTVLEKYTTSLRKHVSPECIVWEPDYRTGHSRTTLSCHVNPAGDIPETLYAWAMEHRFHLVILSRPENLHPDELASLDEMMRVLYGIGAYVQDAAQRDSAFALFEEMVQHVTGPRHARI